MTPARIEWFQNKRLAAKKSRATVNRETEILRAAFRLAQKRRVVRHLPYFPMFELDNQRRGFFESDEVESVARSLPEPIRDAMLFAFFSGWRKGEILPLRWDAVDRVAREVHLFSSKNGRARTLPLERELWNLVERRWRARRIRSGALTHLCPLVFHDGGHPLGDFRNAWAKACEAAGLSGRVFHDLRRTAIRNMVRAGVPKTVAMSISGHRTAAVFDRYDIESGEDKRKALRDAQAYVASDRVARDVLNRAPDPQTNPEPSRRKSGQKSGQKGKGAKPDST